MAYILIKSNLYSIYNYNASTVESSMQMYLSDSPFMREKNREKEQRMIHLLKQLLVCSFVYAEWIKNYPINESRVVSFRHFYPSTFFSYAAHDKSRQLLNFTFHRLHEN